MLAAAYARYSTDKQTENSIAYQMSKIESYCSEHNILIGAKYIDEGFSGTNTMRQGFQQMVTDAAAITLNNPLLSFKKIDFIKSEVKKGSITYKLKKKAAENLISVLDRICRSAEPTVSYVQPQINISAADEIKKFKELLDAGIITEDEFNAKKKQLLGI